MRFSLRNWFPSLKKSNDTYYFEGITPLSKYLPIKNKYDIYTAYQQTPPLQGMINKAADMFSNIDVVLKDKDGEIIRDYKFKHPFYSESEFLATYYKQIKLFNECYILIDTKLPRIIDEDTKFLILPAQDVEIITVSDLTPSKLQDINQLEDVIVGYKFTVSGKSKVFPVKDILHITTASMRFDDNGYIEPDYSLIAAEQPINAIRAAYEARIGLLRRKGGTNVLTNTAITDGRKTKIRPDDKKELQDWLKSYSFNKNDYQTIVTNATLQNLKLNYPVKDLELSEAILDAKIDIGDVLGFNVQVLNILEGTTFANKEQANKELYTNLMLPGWRLFAGELNNWSLNEDYIDFDISQIEALQESRKEAIESDNLLNEAIITINTEIRTGNITAEIGRNILVDVYKLEPEQADNFINTKSNGNSI